MSAIIPTITVDQPKNGTAIAFGTPIFVSGTTTGGIVGVKVRLKVPSTNVGQPYIDAVPGAAGWGTWTASITPIDMTYTRVLAQATLANNTTITSTPNVVLTYTTGTPTPTPTPTPGTASVRITSPPANSIHNVLNPLPVSGTFTGTVISIDVRLKETGLISPPGQAYVPATMGPAGTWFATIQPAKESYTKIQARATLPAPALPVYHDIIISFTGVIAEPPPPPPPDPVPDPDPVPTPTGTGIWDKLKALLPASAQPYALPIAVGLGGIVMMKGGFGFLKRGGKSERYRTYVSGVR